MKKLLAIIAVVLLSRFSFADPSTIGTQPASAGWNFGNVTYAQEGGSLVLNSLSDRYGISTFQTANTNGQSTQLLGTNDYIPEAAVKNQLAIDGYTVAYDLNPQYAGLYGGAYNQALPTNVPLTELSFTGLAGDPTAIQNVYVLTSEYNRLSAEGQASSISTLNTGLATTNTTVSNLQSDVNTNVTNVTNLTNGLVATNTNVTNLTNTVNTNTANIANNTTSINTLNTGLAATNTQVNTNTSNIANNTAGIAAINNMTDPTTVLNQTVNGNTVAITNETTRAVAAENTLTTNLNQTNAQVNTNTSNISTLNTGLAATNTQVNTNTSNIATLGTGLAQTNVQVNNNTANIGNLYTGLNNETVRATGAEAGLQNQVNATNSRLSSLDSRVDQLEKVKVMADMTVRILDTKKYTVGFFDMYDGTNQRNFAFGARLTYKLGKSYEEKQLEKQLHQIELLQDAVSRLQDNQLK